MNEWTTVVMHGVFSAVIGVAALALMVEVKAKDGWSHVLRVALGALCVAGLGSALSIAKLLIVYDAASVAWLMSGWAMVRLGAMAFIAVWILARPLVATRPFPPIDETLNIYRRGGHGWA